MALYSSAADPGNWQSFVLREDVKSLPVSEQKKKFLTEQLQFEDFTAQQLYLQSNSLNQLNNQLHQGGNIEGNKVLDVNFNGTFPVNQTISSVVFVDFKLPVQVVGGAPFINVINGQQGGGSAPVVQYDYISQASPTRLQFQHTHPADAGGVAVAILEDDEPLTTSISSTTLSGASSGAQTGVTFTYAQGTGASGGADISCNVIVSGGGTTLDSIQIDGTIPSGLYYPGNTFTATAAAIGAGGTGQVVVTLQNSDLLGDILTLLGTSINENGGEIYNVGDNPGAQLDLAYISGDTLTATLA